MASQSQALRPVVNQRNGVYAVLLVIPLGRQPSENFVEGDLTRASGVLLIEAGLLVPETKTSPRKGTAIPPSA